MPRPPRRCPGGLVYHVLNRAVARRQIFLKNAGHWHASPPSNCSPTA
ncbi:MAG TPA: hypothetical protein VH475_15950 [Tepidisphaeraceae bacterium]